MSELKPIISAKNVEEFTRISDELNKLPESILDQILKAQHSLIGIECTLRHTFGKQEVRVNLPNYTTQIKDFGDYIGIYSGKFFFKIEGDLMKCKLHYVFINVESKDVESKKD
jgi:hypothetical protein